VGAFLRLGWTEPAHELLAFFREMTRPEGWNQWPEVVARDAREPRFLGDLPHTWVGSDYVRSFLDGFAYTRSGDGALVVGAGIPEAWLAEGPIAVRGLRTEHGTLDITMRREEDATAVELGGDLVVPAAGIEVCTPAGRRLVHEIPTRIVIVP
jgi:hypothetical protein